MGYYAAGDWYTKQGDPGVSALARRFMPGVGRKIVRAVRPIAKALPASELMAAVRTPSRAMQRKYGMGRRRRRMNPCNPRALRRALRRAKSFEHFAKSVYHFVGRRHGPRFKMHRRRRRY